MQVEESSPLPGRWRSDSSLWVRAVMEDFANNGIRDFAAFRNGDPRRALGNGQVDVHG